MATRRSSSDDSAVAIKTTSQKNESCNLAHDFYASEGLDLLLPASYKPNKGNNTNGQRNVGPVTKRPTAKSVESQQGQTQRYVPTFGPPGTSHTYGQNTGSQFYTSASICNDRPQIKDLLLKPGYVDTNDNKTTSHKTFDDSRFHPGEDFAFKAPHPVNKQTTQKRPYDFPTSSANGLQTRPHSLEQCRKRKYVFEKTLAQGVVPEAKRGKSDAADNFSMDDPDITDELKDIGWRVLQGRSMFQITHEIDIEDKNNNAQTRTNDPKSSTSNADNLKHIPGTYVTNMNGEDIRVNWFAYSPLGISTHVPSHTPDCESMLLRTNQRMRRTSDFVMRETRKRLWTMKQREPERETFRDMRDLHRVDSNLYFDFTSQTWKEYTPSEYNLPSISAAVPTSSEKKPINRKRKLENETKSSDEDELFSDRLLFSGPSCKKTKTDHDKREN